jgi:hypothetical protein
MFLAFILRGHSFPVHDFLWGLLFGYGVQLHDLAPNTVLHIACLVTLCEYFLGVEPHWALWKRIFGVKRQALYQTRGFGCFMRAKLKYFNLRTLENNLGWQQKWLYVKDQPSAGREIGLEEFRVASDLQARQSWENSLSEEEMAIT